MKIQVEFEPENKLVFNFDVGTNDNPAGKAALAKTSCYFKLPEELDIEAIHPDVLALAALTVVSPWAGRKIQLSWSISKEFSDAVLASLNKSIGPVDHRLPPRNQPVPEEGRPGLAFSGGVDSFAQLLLMPDTTAMVFAYRIPREQDLYNPEAALQAVALLQSEGRLAFCIETDMEYVRQPAGFATDLMSGAPSILLADHLGLDSLGFGTISNAAYGIGKGKFTEYTSRRVFRTWQSLLRSVGLEYFNSVSAISELGTMAIVEGSHYSSIAESCVRGKFGEPCKKCVKCFRKQLMRAHYTGEWPNDSDMSSYAKSAGVRDELVGLPIRQEFIYQQILNAYNGPNELLLLLKSRLEFSNSNTGFSEKAYKAGFDAATPLRYRAQAWQKLIQTVPPMSPKDEQEFRNYDISSQMTSLSRSEDFEMYSSTVYLIWALLKLGES